MVDHFMSSVWQAKKLKGKAKAMVVTRNIECAIRYFFAIRTALQEANAPFKALVAFSGEKTVDGIKYTEDGINGIAVRDLPDEFEKDDYKILVVANKYLTGFDEPMLHTMYVDKKLQGVLAVQALLQIAATLGNGVNNFGHFAQASRQFTRPAVVKNKAAND